MTKIDIYSGFLGAGKTTLIKTMIESAYSGEKLVLIENEFGEIGIDGGFLKEAGIQITEMNSGCICCSLVGDFETSLKEVLKQYAPDRIVIEPSGVGKLSDVIKAVESIKESDIQLNCTVAVVDAMKCKMYMKNFGEFFNNQISHAKTIVLSRTGQMKEDKLEVVVTMIRDKNANASIITTPWNELNAETILKTMEQQNDLEKTLLKETLHDHAHDHDHHQDKECGCGHEHDKECGCGHDHHQEHGNECGCGHDHGHHHAEDVFTSWGTETPKKFKKDSLGTMLQELSMSDAYGMILRAKGILPDSNGDWLYFDLTPGEYEIRKGAPDYTGRICVIGTELKIERIEQLLEL